MSPPAPALGAIIAGGASRRFGSPKALARVGRAHIVDHVRAALEGAGLAPVLVTAREELSSVPLPRRPDLAAGEGPASGVLTALVWAAELGAPGAVCVACDLPFLSSELLRRLVELGGRPEIDAASPQSPRGEGLEPLCTWYSVSCIPALEQRLRAGERSLRGLLASVRTEVAPLEEMQRFGDPRRMLLNVNTPADHLLAEQIAMGDAERARR